MAVSQIGRILGLSDDELNEMAARLGVEPRHYDGFKMVMTKEEWDNVPKILEAIKKDKKIRKDFTLKEDKIKITPSPLRYLGFNPKGVAAQLFTKARECTITKRDEATLEFNDMKLFEHCDLKTDLRFFITLFLERGNNPTKIWLNCPEKEASIIKRKFCSYGIPMSYTGSTITASTPTLARIAQAFSVITAIIIAEQNIESKLISKLLGNIPLLMRHCVYSSMLDQMHTGFNLLRDLAIILNVEMSILLANPKEKRRMMSLPLGDLLEKSQKYVDATISSSSIWYSAQTKAKVLIKAGIYTFANKKCSLSEAVSALSVKVSKIKENSSLTYSEVCAQISNPGN